jgi:hypothetical protein
LSKFPLDWMIEEAKTAGLRIHTAMRNHLVLGHERKGSGQQYVAPDPNGRLHDSMTAGWRVLEWLPKRAKWREDAGRRTVAGWYLPRAEPRPIPEGARIHYSVIARRDANPCYRPANLPIAFEIEKSTTAGSDQTEPV